MVMIIFMASTDEIYVHKYCMQLLALLQAQLLFLQIDILSMLTLRTEARPSHHNLPNIAISTFLRFLHSTDIYKVTSTTEAKLLCLCLGVVDADILSSLAVFMATLGALCYDITDYVLCMQNVYNWPITNQDVELLQSLSSSL